MVSARAQRGPTGNECYPRIMSDADVTNFRRNHVIAGLTDISVLLDCQTRSGSRHEVEQAIIYGRPVLLWAPALAGQPWGRQLVASGAATFVSSAKEIVTALQRGGNTDWFAAIRSCATCPKALPHSWFPHR
jgi:predicted Rossmann fold nucleotide-binding protein DprA/Smf involved in DNA uptake